MTRSLYDFSIETFVPMLRSLSEILDKARTDKQAAVTVDDRLAPDMFSLAQQVQVACDHATNNVARLTGMAAPVFADKERTLAALKERIASTIAWLERAKPEKFEGAASRSIEIPGPPGMKFSFTGEQLFRDWALPHFYFHVVTAYDILRHKGVDLGKRDYLSHVGRHLGPA
jgi:hypothetical protein